MIKKLMVLFALIALSASVTSAQWNNQGVWPDSMNIGATHGIAVDPDGKVWWNSYYASLDWDQGTDTVKNAGIVVYNADGTEADFSPIFTIATGGGFVEDTIMHANSRGLSTDELGNIVYTRNGNVFKIDYKTGVGISKADIATDIGSSPTNAAVADDGTVFIGPVVGGGASHIAMYDKDLAYIGSAVAAPPGIARTMQVSADGNTIYWIPFTIGKMFIYTRADEFSSFALADSALDGMVSETSSWNATTGDLWLSNLGDNGAYTNLSFYAYDTDTKAIVDSTKWMSAGGADNKPRGLAFSPDGNMAYLGTFDNTNTRMEKALNGEPEQVNLTLQVDMSVQIDKGNFTVGTDVVRAAGAFQDPEWTPADAPDMTDADEDKIYTVTYQVDPSKTYEYKYLIGTDWGSNEDNNRSVDVGESDMTVEPVYYNNDDGVETTEIAVSFECNMELEIAASRFNPATDTLTARGSFNGWSDATMLTPSVSDPNIYEGSAQYESFDGDVIFYKFAYTYSGGVNWENNPPTGSGNYEQTVSATDITNGYTIIPQRGYNNATLETVVNQESVIRFIVNMDGAVDGNGIAFTSVDNVTIAGANLPLQWPDGGWPDSDSNKVVFMVDDGTNGDDTAGDNFWTAEVTFPIYSPLDIEYKYGANWGLTSNGGANDNEGGVGTNHHATLFSGFWSGDAVDIFGTFDTKDVVNGVEPIGDVLPNAYVLGQNYPNPFNPSTVINFSIPESGLVTMKVFNTLGQEVAELVNDVKSAGTYEVSFDASNLTTGMYIYKIQVGNYSATKKMMLVK